jgi:hypothetical protein
MSDSEVMFPIKDSALRERLFGEILQNYLKDTEKTRIRRAIRKAALTEAA